MSHRKKNKQTKNSTGVHNTRVYIAIGILALIILAAFLFRPNSNVKENNEIVIPEQASQAYPDEITPAQALEKQNEGAFVLDVREQKDWMAGHIKGSELIPFDELSSRLDEIPSDREIIVVCRSGMMSSLGRDILRKAGYEQVASMAGGMIEWSRQGYQVVIAK